ncbi:MULTISPECIES: 4Fe-4S binding protein [Rhodanobacter]|uniref:4Fe-4S binding protein n=1 Tax=Rhodanobacter TaxID=75309 RepID=UPI000487FED6|nr:MULTISPECIES: 4Fe-4S binding protein [Rhodanobacter]TAN16005.1 MAG: 4Fe-4S binding protein [Rhodanobacter sp.]UJJ54666.1 4Fe-4S binding protein [Rhodanobacter thiooxydans]
MNRAPISDAASGAGTARLARLGLAMRRHRKLILGIQWVVVLGYTVLVCVPAFLPLPPEQAHVWNNLTRFAQFVFWGIWWPFVILSIMLLGRMWCGVLCPEGALTEWASGFGLGRGIPRWMKWSGWPFVAFVMTTVFGQMTSVYDYPKPALLILGGSTVAAIATGLVWGREKRIWCRHLCPVSGVFGLLAKIAPLHFSVDQAAWDTAPAGHRTSRKHPVNCAPMIDIRRMQSASACHMCGRCAGERGAVTLAARSPSTEILAARSGMTDADKWPVRLLIFGMLGVALGAFQWSASPWLVAAKQAVAGWLIDRQAWWPLNDVGHWWLFTDYPEANDAFTWLDGGLLLAYIAAETILVGGWIRLWLHLAERLSGLYWRRLAYTLIPFAGASLFVGLSLLTSAQLHGEGIALPWANGVRMALLTMAGAWSTRLAWRLAPRRRLPSMAAILAAVALPYAAWGTQFFLW